MNSPQTLKILIIDDEEGITEGLGEHFSHQGYNVFVANDGKTGLESFKKERPRICFIDIWMTRGTHEGMDILRSIKDFDKDAYCIMMGPCHDEQNTVKQAKELGALHFINKVFENEVLDQFVEEVKGLIAKRSA